MCDKEDQMTGCQFIKKNILAARASGVMVRNLNLTCPKKKKSCKILTFAAHNIMFDFKLGFSEFRFINKEVRN